MTTPRTSREESWVGTSRPVSRILCPPRKGGRRPSIWALRRRVPQAVHPRTRASSPSMHRCTSSAQTHRKRCDLQPCSGRGLPSHPGHPGRWCALTAPFHPYRAAAGAAVCFLWHFPAGHPGLPLTTTLLCGVRTFLGAGPFRPPASVPRPAAVRPTRSAHSLDARAPGAQARAGAHRPVAPSDHCSGRGFPAAEFSNSGVSNVSPPSGS